MNNVVRMRQESPFRIEKRVPMPRRIYTECPYPFMDMERGDSFLVPLGSNSYTTVFRSLNRWWDRFKKQHPEGGYVFAARRCPGGVRCWRMK